MNQSFNRYAHQLVYNEDVGVHFMFGGNPGGKENRNGKLRLGDFWRLELERQQNELKELLEEQKNAQSMEAEERAKLQEEIEAKQREIEEMRSVLYFPFCELQLTFDTLRDSVNEREEQSKQLQEEMEEAKLRMEVSFGLKCSQI